MENFWPKYPELRHIILVHYFNMTSFGIFRPKVFKFIPFFIVTINSFHCDEKVFSLKLFIYLEIYFSEHAPSLVSCSLAGC